MSTPKKKVSPTVRADAPTTNLKVANQLKAKRKKRLTTRRRIKPKSTRTNPPIRKMPRSVATDKLMKDMLYAPMPPLGVDPKEGSATINAYLRRNDTARLSQVHAQVEKLETELKEMKGMVTGLKSELAKLWESHQELCKRFNRVIEIHWKRIGDIEEGQKRLIFYLDNKTELKKIRKQRQKELKKERKEK